MTQLKFINEQTDCFVVMTKNIPQSRNENLSFMRTLFTIILSVYTFLGIAQDIRKTNWGASMNEVKLSEGQQEWGAPAIADNGTTVISYIGKVSTMKALIAFYFVNDKLYSVRYIIAEDHTNKNEYISDYESINQILTDKYGATEVNRVWTNNLYKRDTQEHGMAIAVGHYKLLAIWNDLEKTKINHAMLGDNYEISHWVIYNSKEFAKDVEAKSKEKDKSDF